MRISRQILYFGLGQHEFFLLILASFLFSTVLSLFFLSNTSWTFFGFFLFIFILGQICMTASRYVILPGLISLVACLQWVVAPTLSYFFPPQFYLFHMSLPMDEYLSFSVLSTFALWLGIQLPLKLRATDIHFMDRQNTPLDKGSRLLIDLIIIVSIGLDRASYYTLGQLGFLFYLVGQIRFVGAFMLMFSRSRGWAIRVFIVYLDLLIFATSSGLFYGFILWSAYLFVSLVYMKKWKWEFIFFLALALVLMSMFNSIKREYRYHTETNQISTFGRFVLLSDLMMDNRYGKEYYYDRQDDMTIGDKLVRYNQGWIISRVMGTVPAVEPYANGKTILRSIYAAIVPRVFQPAKIGAASNEMFKQYTNLNLGLSTSMGLGIIGEFYANFGRGKAILAAFIYGYLLGLFFSKFFNLAKQNILWWAWVPFVLLPTVEAEWNLVDILNHVTKATLVMILLIYAVPFFQRKFISKKSHIPMPGVVKAVE